MTIPTLPTWTDQEVQSAGKLNLLTAALEAKFAGSIGGADLAWPLVAQGVIDMNGFNVIGLKKFWNVFNADEYEDLQAAIDAAEAAGGSGVFIPPNNTNNDAEGLTISDTLHIFGAGKKSVISLTSAATAGELIATTGSPSDIGFSNLVIDGASMTGSGQNGIVLKNVSGAMFDRVIFQNFSGDALKLDNEGTAGNQCSNIVLMGCKFSGGTGDHITGNDIEGLNVTNCQFLDPGSDGVVLTPDGVASYMRGIVIESCRFTSVDRAIYIVGASGTANELWRQVQVTDNQVYTASGIAITAGTTSAVLKWVAIKDNTLINTAQGLRVQSEGGEVCDNYTPSCTTVGLDMTDCQNMSIENNRLPDCGTIPIQSTNSDDCRVHGNDVHGSVANSGEPIIKDGTTGNSYRDNFGDIWSVGGHTISNPASDVITAVTDTDFVTTFTIPANSLSVGDVIKVRAYVDKAGTNGSATVRAKLGTLTVGTVSWISTAEGFSWFECLIHVLSTSTTNSFAFQVQESSGANQTQTSQQQAGAADFTSDLILKFSGQVTSGDNIQLEQVFWEIV